MLALSFFRHWFLRHSTEQFVNTVRNLFHETADSNFPLNIKEQLKPKI